MRKKPKLPSFFSKNRENKLTPFWVMMTWLIAFIVSLYVSMFILSYIGIFLIVGGLGCILYYPVWLIFYKYYKWKDNRQVE